MRIIEETPDRLTLEDCPWVLGAALAMAIFAMVLTVLLTGAEKFRLATGMTLGVALLVTAFVAFVRRVIVIFDRRTGTVTIRTTSVTGRTETTHALADIQRAGIDTSVSRSTGQSSGRSSVSTTHRPVLHLPDCAVPLTDVYSGGSGASRIAEAVGRWLGVPHS